MEHALVFLSAPDACSYLPNERAQMRYELAPHLTSADYMTRLREGWRRFGPIVFRNECPTCRKCQSLRVPVDTFRPSASQRRAWSTNSGEVDVRISTPSSSPEKLDLFRRFHRHGHRRKGGPPIPATICDSSRTTRFPLRNGAITLASDWSRSAISMFFRKGSPRSTSSTIQLRASAASERSMC